MRYRRTRSNSSLRTCRTTTSSGSPRSSVGCVLSPLHRALHLSFSSGSPVFRTPTTTNLQILPESPHIEFHLLWMTHLFTYHGPALKYE